MKNLIAVVALFASAKAMALSPMNSWSEIFSARNAMVTTEFSTSLQGIALENSCVTDTTVQTIKPVEVCVKSVEINHRGNGQEGPYTETKCVQYANQQVVSPRTYLKQVCTNLQVLGHGEATQVECVEYGMVSVTVPGTVTVTVRESRGEFENSFNKAFTFPTCK